MTKDEALKQAPVIGTKTWFEDGKVVTQHLTAKDIYKDPEQPEQERPPNCGTGYCSCIECVMEPEQEPFGYFRYDLRLDAWVQNRAGITGTPFYTTPPQRTWVGLTDEEILEWRKRYKFSRALLNEVEAKLKEKNT